MLQESATPLIALDAVAIDCEATGVDPNTARLRRIGGVRIRGGRVADGEAPLDLACAGPPEPDAALPGFGDTFRALRRYVRTEVVVGHTAGFDFELITRECARAGVAVRRPRVLDTRLLAEIARPDLAGFSLEEVAAWLGIAAEPGRVDGDGPGPGAVATARLIAQVFVALVPELRAGGIRTLAEAEQACRVLIEAREGEHRARYGEAAAPAQQDAESTFASLDSYPYRHRVQDVMARAPVFATEATTLAGVAALMAEHNISSIFVAPPGKRLDDAPFDAARCGVVTERDVLRAVAARGAGALAEPVTAVMSAPLAAVPADAFVYRAIGRMDRLKVRHLGVIDEIGQVIGALSARDLLRLRAQDAISLGDEIDQADDPPGLARAWAKLPSVAGGLLAEGVPAGDIAAVISRELGALTRRAAILAERRLAEAGRGRPPCPYSVVVLGSAGRGESLLAMDQDNALIFADGEPGGEVDRWFGELGEHLAAILHEVGVPLCKGGVMAKTPAWRGSLATWRERVRHWITRSKPEDLLSVDIFFDMRCVHGDRRMARDVWLWAFEQVRGQLGFAKLLAEAGGHPQPGLGLFGQFKTDTNGRLDIKKVGLFAVVTAARCLAIRHHVLERSTPGRIAGVQALGIGGGRDLGHWIAAQATFLAVVLDQQIADISVGLSPTNQVDPSRFDEDMRDRLKDALRAIQSVDDLVKDLMFSGRG